MNLNDKITSLEDFRAAVDELDLHHNFRSAESILGEATEDNFWRHREFIRLYYSNDYTIIDTSVKRVFMKSSHQDEQHYPHPSKDNSGMIAFTPNEKAGREDRQLTMKPGRFLSKKMGVKDNEDIKVYVSRYNYHHVPPTIYWAVTKEEIIYVYEHGPGSCMMGKGWATNRHPVGIYATEHTRVAYLKDPNDPTRITARTVVREDTKEFIRIYGDADRLTMALQAAGYSSAQRGFIGIKFPMLPNVEKEGDPNTCFLIPYLDGGFTGYRITDNDEIEVCQSSDRRYVAESTSGYASRNGVKECYHCGKTYFEENVYKVNHRRRCSSCNVSLIDSGTIVALRRGTAPNDIEAKHIDYLDINMYKEYEGEFYDISLLMQYGLFFDKSLQKIISLVGNDDYAMCSITSQYALKTEMLEFENEFYLAVPQELYTKFINTKTGHIYKGKPRTSGSHIMTIRALYELMDDIFSTPFQTNEFEAQAPGIKPPLCKALINVSKNSKAQAELYALAA